MHSFFEELKRRNVYKVAVAYLAVAWVIIQVATQTFPFFEIPNWAVRVIILISALGFPVALVIAWAFEITPQGVVRTEMVDRVQAARRPRRYTWMFIALAAALLSIGLVFVGRYSASRSPAVAHGKSIAVLPFDNLSSDPDNAFFADGVQDEILTSLAKIADLKVISRTSVMQYRGETKRNLRDIGQQLGVDHLLEGSVQRAKQTVRVNAQLIDAHTDAHLWAQTYDRSLADVFAIQSEIAKTIADQLRAQLSPTEKSALDERPTNNLAAFDLYRRAKDLLLASTSAVVKQNLLTAVDLLNQAIALDPSFFAAQVQLVTAHTRLYSGNFDRTPARLSEAETALDAASKLRPDAGETHLARAELRYRANGDYPGALAELELARRTLPNDPQIPYLAGAIMRRQGKHEEALQQFERSVELDPRNFFTLQQIARSYDLLRRFGQEVAILDRALEVKPDDVATKVSRAFIFVDWKADTKPLHQVLDEMRRAGPEAVKNAAEASFFCALADRDASAAKAALDALGENAKLGDDVVQLSPDFAKGLLARMSNDQASAVTAFTAARATQEKVLQQQPNYGPALCILGLIDAGLGKKEEALTSGRRAMELLPVEKDSVNGVHMISYFAVIAAWVGEKDLAFQHLATAAKLPGSVTYGSLKLLPWWDPLRGDPRFDAIVASLAPKD